MSNWLGIIINLEDTKRLWNVVKEENDIALTTYVLKFYAIRQRWDYGPRTYHVD